LAPIAAVLIVLTGLRRGPDFFPGKPPQVRQK